MTDENRTELSTNEARQGATPHITRNVLRWGTVGAIVALAVVWLVVAR